MQVSASAPESKKGGLRLLDMQRRADELTVAMNRSQ
jgi:hypothetical protein